MKMMGTLFIVIVILLCVVVIAIIIANAYVGFTDPFEDNYEQERRNFDASKYDSGIDPFDNHHEHI